MKVILTGAAGFLGSHISDRLITEGHSVVALDDLSTGSMQNIEHLIENPKFDFLEHDVRDSIHLTGDAILNFACPASPVQYQADPVRTIETNFLGIINMLRLARKLEIPLIQASTSEIYGDPMESPQKESYWGNVNPIGIRSFFDARVIRIFNTYGPRMAVGDGRVVSNFIVQAITGHDLTIYGEGQQTRSFCFVSDLVDGIYKVLTTDASVDAPINLGNPREFSMLDLARAVIRLTGSSSQITFKNLGNPREFSMLDLARAVIRLTGSSSQITFKELPLDDPRQRKPDVSRARDVLGWEPTIELEEGVKRTIKYFKELLAL